MKTGNVSTRESVTLSSVACQTDKSGSEKHRRRRRTVAAAVAEILEKGDKDDDLRKIYDDYDDSSDDEEDLYENIQIQQEIIESVRYQPWSMTKKQNLVALAKSYVEKHEGQLSRSRGYKEKGAQFWRRIKREVTNLQTLLTPWDMRIKAIESHFGTVVASYFLFLRWLIGINISLTLLPVCFVIIPELTVGEPHGSTNRKQLPASQQETYADLKTIWNAEGILKFSAIFYGYYGNNDKIGSGYRLPLAYLLTAFAFFAFSFIVVLRKMASNSRLSRLSSKDEQFTFSWRLFSSWDFTIGHSETANTKSASIVTTFRELILEEKEKEKHVNKYTLFGLRVLANVGVLLTLAISTYIIQLCVERSRELDIRKRNDDNYVAGFWEENELTLVMTLIATIFPNFFDLFSLMEKYHPRINLRWQLASGVSDQKVKIPNIELLYNQRLLFNVLNASVKLYSCSSLMINLLLDLYTFRIFVLNLLNLYTLFIALFWKQQDLKNALQEKIKSRNCTDMISNSTTTTETLLHVNQSYSDPAYNCTSDPTKYIESDLCWETMIGQEVFKLTVMDLVFVVGQILIQDYIRGLFVRYCNSLCCWDLERTFPEYGDFKTTENILHLINNQGMIWLGTFFAPGLAVLNLVKLLILLYVRCWSVMVCNVPQEAIFRSSRSNNFYYALLLVMLFLTMLPPLFAIVAVDPSPHCGPYSGQKQILHILTEAIEKDLPTVVASVIEYTVSPFVILPVFMLLGMTIYYLLVVSRSLREANKELRNQLEYERTEGKRKIYAMADAKWELNTEGTNIQKPKDPIKGQTEKKSAANKGKSAIGKAAMSVLAAARVAKMLSSKNTQKVAPSSSPVQQRTMIASVERHQSVDNRPQESETNANKNTKESSLDTPVAVVHATQALRKKATSNMDRSGHIGSAVSHLWRRPGQQLPSSSQQQSRGPSNAALQDTSVTVDEPSHSVTEPGVDTSNEVADGTNSNRSDVLSESYELRNLNTVQKYALLKHRRVLRASNASRQEQPTTSDPSLTSGTDGHSENRRSLHVEAQIFQQTTSSRNSSDSSD